MKAVLAGILAAIVIAIGAAYILDSEVQRTAQAAFTTQGARL